MKLIRMMSLVLALLMMIAPCAMAEETAQKIDVVILIDHSKSMDSARMQPSDPDGWRITAAQMIVKQLDLDPNCEVRVAIVPFAGTLIDPDTELAAAGTKKIDDMEKLHKKATRPDTDHGNAVSYAMKLLVDREDKSAAAHIIVMTDGKQELTKKGGAKTHEKKKIHLYDSDSHSYSEVVANDYGVDNDNSKSNGGRTINATTQLNDAVQAATDNGVTIHIAAFGNMPTVALPELQAICDQTGGFFAYVQDAEELATDFALNVSNKMLHP